MAFINGYKDLDNVPFTDFDDYFKRVHDTNNPVVAQLLSELRQNTSKNSPNPMKKDVEVSLILSGAFDFYEPNRYKLLNHFICDIRKDSEVKIMGKKTKVPLDESEYKRKTKLALEKFYMGSYISEHPLDTFPYADFDSCCEGEQIYTTGILTSVTVKNTKKGKPFMSIKFKAKDDIERTANVFDAKSVTSLQQDLKKNQIIMIKGTVSKQFNNINAKSVKIALATKQATIAEDLVIEDKTDTDSTEMMFVSQDPVGLKDIFAT